MLGRDIIKVKSVTGRNTQIPYTPTDVTATFAYYRVVESLLLRQATTSEELAHLAYKAKF